VSFSGKKLKITPEISQEFPTGAELWHAVRVQHTPRIIQQYNRRDVSSLHATTVPSLKNFSTINCCPSTRSKHVADWNKLHFTASIGLGVINCTKLSEWDKIRNAELWVFHRGVNEEWFRKFRRNVTTHSLSHVTSHPVRTESSSEMVMKGLPPLPQRNAWQ
jgi:hypothetical protein